MVESTCNKKWKDVVAAYRNYHLQLMGIVKEFRSDLVELVRQSLNVSEERGLALYVASTVLRPQELKPLPPILLSLSSWENGYTEFSRDALLGIDPDWLREQLPGMNASVFEQTSDESLRCLFEVYRCVDLNLTRELITTAMQSANQEVREAATELQAKMESA